ncbi:MAG: SDR family NAD(P)-dependent oxidoreductase [Pseudomonadota bacterium]|nr:SDR family NAD(P)-dependent oxidoreductase [Pseudomonadota bacterium]
MALDWNRARALVSGGASGLGRAVVESLVAAGGRAVILDANGPGGELMAERLGPRAFSVRTDVGSFQAVDQAVTEAVQRLGAIDLAVCCAGAASGQRLLGRDGPHDPETFEQALRVNLTGTFNLVRAAAAAMEANSPLDEDGGRGVIIMTASIAAFDGQIGQAAYAASKGGVASMTLPLARELARIGIRVLTVAPGLFDTPLTRSLPESVREDLAAEIPFPKRLGNPSEYAALVRAIYENPALNGEIIRLDGSLRMGPG